MKWFLVDHDKDDKKVRGPYDHSETAAAVRAELEANHEYYRDYGNLWIVSEGQ
jgi:hypothetical protein